jgi:6-pyruvoyltetrahydropterin/6-carboxytetrahydropterin synthase
MVERLIKIRELTFSAAHYIKGHPKCSALHGHTYFVRNIEVLYDAPEGDFVDLGLIKAVVQEFDHKLLIPSEDSQFWLRLSVPCKIPFIEIPGQTTVENIAELIASIIKSILYVKSVRLEVYEGPNAGAVYET